MEESVHENFRSLSLSFSQLLSKTSSKLFADEHFQNSLDVILSNLLSTWRSEISLNKKIKYVTVRRYETLMDWEIQSPEEARTTQDTCVITAI